jgi:hypothetical protein
MGGGEVSIIYLLCLIEKGKRKLDYSYVYSSLSTQQLRRIVYTVLLGVLY